MRIVALLHALALLITSRSVSAKHDAHAGKGKTVWDTPAEGKKTDGPEAPPAPAATIASVWNPSSQVQSQLGGLFELLRPPLPPFRRIVETTTPKRVLEIGAAEGRMLMAATVLLEANAKETGNKVCGAGINSLAYKFGTDKMPGKPLHGGEAIWWGVMKREDFADIAHRTRLPMPIETPHHVHDDVFSPKGGVCFHAGAADLLYSQASLDKWRHYPMSFTGWNATTVLKRIFGEPEVVASMTHVCTDMARVMRVGGTVHVQITTTSVYNATQLKGFMSSLPTPAFDGTMLPLLMGFGKMPAATAEELESTRINEFARHRGSRPTHMEEAATKLHHVCNEPEAVDEPTRVGTERCVASLYYLTSVPASAFKTTKFERGPTLWTSQNLMLFMHSYPAPPAGTHCEDALPPILKETVPPLREVMARTESTGGSAVADSERKAAMIKMVRKFRWHASVQTGILSWMTKLSDARVYDLHGISTMPMATPKVPKTPKAALP